MLRDDADDTIFSVPRERGILCYDLRGGVRVLISRPYSNLAQNIWILTEGVIR